MSNPATPPPQHTPAPAKAEASPATRAGQLTSMPYGLVALAALAGAVWAVYGRSIHAPLVFDDKVSITGNTSIEQLWPLVGVPLLIFFL